MNGRLHGVCVINDGDNDTLAKEVSELPDLNNSQGGSGRGMIPSLLVNVLLTTLQTLHSPRRLAQMLRMPYMRPP